MNYADAKTNKARIASTTPIRLASLTLAVFARDAMAANQIARLIMTRLKEYIQLLNGYGRHYRNERGKRCTNRRYAKALLRICDARFRTRYRTINRQSVAFISNLREQLSAMSSEEVIKRNKESGIYLSSEGGLHGEI